ncbi:uncharacterized protein LOC133312134, partial [Gastrolobium bilobum]|uniref:uncharacterized protein LOC133312134 n=1 Tax=Gastrolobium bilobum TaxID=150636 RepID=UPI002AB15292
MPEAIFEDLSLDFITGLPQSNGFSVVLVVVDHLSKYAYFIGLSHCYTAATVAKIFCEHIVKLHGFPRSLVSDRDPIFMSKFWQKLFSLSGTKLKTSSSYHPHTDGQTEVTNRYLEQYLRAFCAEQHKKWSSFLCWVELHYNSSVHSSIGMSPFQAVYGRVPPSIPHYPRGLVPIEALDTLLCQRNDILSSLKANLLRTQNRMKNQADRHCRDLLLAEDDLPFWGTPGVHFSPLPPHTFDNKPVQKPLAILASRSSLIRGMPQMQYLVQWTDTIPEDATWELGTDLQAAYPALDLEDKNKSFKKCLEMAEIKRENDGQMLGDGFDEENDGERLLDGLSGLGATMGVKS